QGRRAGGARRRRHAVPVGQGAHRAAGARPRDRRAHDALLRGSLRRRGCAPTRARARDRPAGTVRARPMRALTHKGIRIDDTFAEAFGMRATALVITADSARWARQAAVTMTGFATSV